MDVREIIIIVGILVIIGIIADGLRRMKNPNKVKATRRTEEPYIDPEQAEKEAQIARELPNGGARARAMTEEERKQAAGALNLRERVPMLMERVKVQNEEPEELSSAADSAKPQAELDFNANTPLDSEDDDLALDALETNPSNAEARSTDIPDIKHDQIDMSDHENSESDDDDFVADIYSKGKSPQLLAEENAQFAQPVKNETAPKNAAPKAKAESPTPKAPPKPAPKPQPKQEPVVDSKPAEPVDEKDTAPVEEVIVMHVMAPDGGLLSGSTVLNLLITAGLRHGEMDIFHYRNPKNQMEFSLANCVHPGTFNPDNMHQVNTPGVTLFMQLPMAADIMEAFDHMHQMADYLAKKLDAVVLDEDHNKVTAQRLEYYREHLRTFARSKLIRH